MTAISFQPLLIREEKTAYLRAKVRSLKKKDREKFYSLFDCKQEKGNIWLTISNPTDIYLFDLQVRKSQLRGFFVQIILPSGPSTVIQTMG